MDRNFYYANKDCDWVRSLSARRAWIEMMEDLEPSTTRRSLSARRAWIEMPISRGFSGGWKVSLSARRAWIEIALLVYLALIRYRRSPQGERG